MLSPKERRWLRDVNLTIGLAECMCGDCVICCIMRPLYLSMYIEDESQRLSTYEDREDEEEEETGWEDFDDDE